MSAPFGNHPTLNEYLMWAYTQGYRAKSVLTQDDNGKMCTLQKVTAPDGRYVFAPDMAANERLRPLQVGYLDRRLALNSPFSKLQLPDD
jgi:hypothetical protein